MSETNIKLRIIFLPFVLLSLGIMVAFCFLKWLLEIKLHLITLNDTMYNFVLPFFISLLLLIVVGHKRICLLIDLEKTRGSHSAVMFAFPALAFTGFTYLAINYTTSEFNRLTIVSNADEMLQHKHERYFTIPFYNLQLDTGKRMEKFSMEWRKSNKGSAPHYDFESVVVFPVIPENNMQVKKMMWYCMMLDQTHDATHLNRKTADSLYSRFSDSCRVVISRAQDSIYRTDHFEKLPDNDDREKYYQLLREHNLANYQADEMMFIIGHRAWYENRSNWYRDWLIGSWTITFLIFLIIIMYRPINEETLEEYTNGTLLKDNFFQAKIRYLYQHKGIGIAVISGILVAIALYIIFLC